MKVYIRLKKDASSPILGFGGFMMNLTDLGFMKNVVYETILSTYNQDGSPNAAPMGAIMQDQQTIALNIYNTSQTKRNIEKNRCAVVNMTNDIELFYKTTFKEANPNGKLPLDWFETAQSVNAPSLKSAGARIEVLLDLNESTNPQKTRFIVKANHIKADMMPPQAYCRAMTLTLEAIIHATRVKAFAKDNSKKEQVTQLLQTIENFKGIINRTAPNSVYSEAIADLTKRIDLWRNIQ